jgi:predicted phosphoribosyltransferase
MQFRDRADAGRKLAANLRAHAGGDDAIVLGLGPGGVAVAEPVAAELAAPLDIFTVQELGVPWDEALAMGMVASGGAVLIDDQVIRQLGVRERAVREAVSRELRALGRRERAHRRGRAPLDARGRAVILVDDGLTGAAPLRAAVQVLRRRRPTRLVLAAPVAPPGSCSELRALVDEIVCAVGPSPFRGAGMWQIEFPPINGL